MAAGSSPIQVFDKDPLAVLDYTIDWGKWLANGETLNTASWTIPGVLSSTGAAFSGSTATIFLLGGVSGVSYSVYCVITTTAGRIDKRTILINVLDR